MVLAHGNRAMLVHRYAPSHLALDFCRSRACFLTYLSRSSLDRLSSCGGGAVGGVSDHTWTYAGLSFALLGRCRRCHGDLNFTIRTILTGCHRAGLGSCRLSLDHLLPMSGRVSLLPLPPRVITTPSGGGVHRCLVSSTLAL